MYIKDRGASTQDNLCYPKHMKNTKPLVRACCLVCKEEFSLVNVTLSKGLCFNCRNRADVHTNYLANKSKIIARKRTYRLAHPEKQKAFQSNYMKRALYGLDFKSHQVMLVAQDNKCAICGRAPYGSRPVLNVDHNHKTGQYRELLCRDCNLGLAPLENNPQGWLPKALAYLSKHGTQIS